MAIGGGGTPGSKIVQSLGGIADAERVALEKILDTESASLPCAPASLPAALSSYPWPPPLSWLSPPRLSFSSAPRGCRQLAAAAGLDNLLYSADADFSCFADLALTSPQDYYKQGEGSLLQ